MFGKEDQLDVRDKNVSCNGFSVMWFNDASD